MKPLPADDEAFPHVVRDKSHRRNGQRCEIVGKKGGLQLVQIRFEDGFTAIVRRNMLRRTKRVVQ
jgi:hypothetical protein